MRVGGGLIEWGGGGPTRCGWLPCLVVSWQVTKWEDFVPALNKKCIVLTPFCNETEWEETVKKRSREEAGGDEDARTATR